MGKEIIKRPFKILCIDGGGIKGLYSAKLLACLETEFKTQVNEQFDLICGTSTGGIIALGGASGIPMIDIVDFYKNKGPEIFYEKRKKIPFYKSFIKLRQATWGSKYSAKRLKRSLLDVFGSKKIKESKTLLCIPALNLGTGQPRVFKKDYSSGGISFSSDDEKSFVDIAMATSAAPTYFPAHRINDEVFIDGGVWANDPVLTGLLEYYYMFFSDERFSGVHILSISSCEKATGDIQKLNRGFLGVRDALFDSYSHGQSHFAHFLISKVSPCASKGIKCMRIVNKQLSGKQHKIIDMDNATSEAFDIMLNNATTVAAEYKLNEDIKDFFTSGKTIFNGK
ncbi:MAG: patatin-like phospholipase family protein [Muribaculum sp.]|nr:patatin-like phospholipase family protein [Muribaculum sp.]